MAIQVNRPPTLTQDEKKDILQLHRYLYQLSGALEDALSVMDGGSGEGTAAIRTAQQGAAVKESAADPGWGQQYQQLKALVIKSANRVTKTITELEGKIAAQYVAESDYGTWKQLMEKTVADNEEAIDVLYGWMESLDTDTSGTELRAYVAQVQTFIKAGLLYYEEYEGYELPRYGVAIGDRLATVEVNGVEMLDRSGYVMTVTSDRLTFWKNNQRLAWFENQQLVVDTVRLAKGMQLGQYAFTVMTDGSMGVVWDG